MKSRERVNAVELVRRIRDEHHEILKDKAPDERRQFYREKARALHEQLGVRPTKERSA